MRGNWRIILATLGQRQIDRAHRWHRCIILGNVLSIAFFNFAGISVTKELSSTTRMVLDSGRTLIIWVVSLALQWQAFYPLQIIGSFASRDMWPSSKELCVCLPLGFALLVIGMGIYNGVWEHLFRRFVTRRPISSERSQLLPSPDAHSDYESTSTISNIASTGVNVNVASSSNTIQT